MIMDLDVIYLARLQFALTIMFHYLFPPLSIGLGALLVFMEGMYLRTGDAQYEQMARFFTKLFAVNFALGVATGIVMEFQFGTNWATYSRFVGDVFGSALAAEGIFAFFLESGFLAVLVFGWDKVSPRMHFFSTLMVALGSIFSAVWIVVANSWMNTPAGFHVVVRDGFARAEITDYWAMVFNPSAVDRLAHTIIGAFILGGFFVMSITAYYILRNRHTEFAKKAFTVALVFAAVNSLLILVSGHFQARNVARYTPAKLAAYEGHYRTGTAAFHLFGIPDDEAQELKYPLAVPGGLSFLVHDNFTEPVAGLDQFPPENRPAVAIPFFTYHVMIGLGMFFIAVTLYALYLRFWRRNLFEKRWLMRVFVVSVLGAYVANQTGWIASETARQPWVVYGLLRTGEAHSKSVVAEQVLASILMFSFVYLLLFAVFLFVMNSKIQHGPDPLEMPDETPGEDLLEAAARRANPSGPSMSLAKQDGLEAQLAHESIAPAFESGTEKEENK